MINEQNIETYLRNQITKHGLMKFILRSPFTSLKQLKPTIIRLYLDFTGFILLNSNFPIRDNDVYITDTDIQKTLEQNTFLSYHILWKCLHDRIRFEYTITIKERNIEIEYRLRKQPVSKILSRSIENAFRQVIIELILDLTGNVYFTVISVHNFICSLTKNR